MKIRVDHPHCCRWAILVAIYITISFAIEVPAFGQIEKTSIAKVSSDVDLYIGGFRVLEPWLRFWESPAVREFCDSSLAKELETEFQQAWKDRRGNMSRVRSILENRNSQEAILFLQDVVSEDVFLTADGTLSDFIRRLAIVQRKSHLLSDPAVSNAEKAELVYGWIDQLGPDWSIPSLILAGSITDKERALSKVDEVEGLLRFGLGMRPEARQALKSLIRIEDKRGSRLQWQLPFASIPWEAVPTNEIFDAESRDRLRDVLSEKAIVLTFGILDGRFVAALGGSTDPLPSIAIESSLLQHPDLQWVRDLSNQRITGIRYTSDRLAGAIFDLGLNGFFSKLANAFLRPATYELENSEFREWLMTCIDDAGRIDSTIEAFVPAPRGATEISLLRDDGWEIHTHDRAAVALFEGSHPLRGMKHWGNHPLLVLNVQLAEHPEYFPASRAIVQRIKQRLDDLKAIPREELPTPEWSELPSIADRAWPLLFQAAELWQNQVLPNMTGEHAFILGAGGLSSHQWHPSLPRSEEPLPIPEAALLSGIRDEQAWIQSLRGWRELFRSILQVSGESSSVAMAILEPQRWEQEGCITWGYPVPDTCPAPKAMMPRLSVEPSWSTICYSDSLAASIRTTVESSIGYGQFDSGKNIAKAAWIDLGGCAAIVTPWVRYAVDQSRGVLENGSPLTVFGIDFAIELSPDEIVHAWRSLEKLGGLSSVTTIADDGSSYCRSIFVFGD